MRRQKQKTYNIRNRIRNSGGRIYGQKKWVELADLGDIPKENRRKCDIFTERRKIWQIQ